MAKDCRHDELLVRARRKNDIKKVFGVTPKRTPQADYLYRAVVKRSAIIEALAGEVRRVTYDNFKDSVSDTKLHTAYLKVWMAMADLQTNKKLPITRKELYALR